MASHSGEQFAALFRALDPADRLVENYFERSIDDLAESAASQISRSTEQPDESRSSDDAAAASGHDRSIRTVEPARTTAESSDDDASRPADSSSPPSLDRQQMLVLGAVLLLAVAVVLIVPVGPGPSLVTDSPESGEELSTIDGEEDASERGASFGADDSAGSDDVDGEVSDDPDSSEVTVTLVPHDRQDGSDDRRLETPGTTSGPAPGVFLTGIDDAERMATEHARAIDEANSVRFRAWVDVLTEANQSIDGTNDSVAPGMAIDSGTIVAEVESNDTYHIRDDTGVVVATDEADGEFGLDTTEGDGERPNRSVESIELFADGERQLTRITDTTGVRYESQPITGGEPLQYFRP